MKYWFSGKMKRAVIILVLIVISNYSFEQQHPQVYVHESDKAIIQQKINKYLWAKTAFDSLKSSIDKYVTIHQTDPEWIVSRLAMYWKKGAHYTQCYIKNETWDYGESNAPVPTVRLPGMRIWNEFTNVVLEDRIPYNESGDMKAFSKKSPTEYPFLVPYKKSGHLIRRNNSEILNLAQRAAFVYWVTGEEKYAAFAADIFSTWLLGTFYMNPPLDPSHRSGGKGGYEPGGIMGYYDYEQIHDNLCLEAVPVYDFMFDYLQSHQKEALKETGKSLTEIAAVVFKRFIEIGLVRGGKKGNWNVNGWEIMMPEILALETNNYYADGKGREYYLKFYTDSSTKYHDALPDILKAYNPVTGLWGEAPRYGLATIVSVLNMALPIYKNGTNTIGKNPMVQKATLASIPWMDARGNMVLFGDMRGGAANFNAFERLLTYYQWTNDIKGFNLLSSVLNTGINAKQYDRSSTDWKGLCYNVGELSNKATAVPYARAAYSEMHRHITMRNGNDTVNRLMFTLYGGYAHNYHLSPNGLAMQLYGKGWALAPDAAGYESYWADDYNYHQSATGSNTILPGYTCGDIHINAMEPVVDSGHFISEHRLSENISFADVSAGEKRRIVAMVRTSPTTGFYVDIFRSNLNNNDYLYHNLGKNLILSGTDGSPLPLMPASDLGTKYNKGYSYFRNSTKALLIGDLHASWTISQANPSITMDMWMLGAKNREVYSLVAPYSSLINSVTPNGANVAPDSTHAIIVRQNNCNGWDMPFISVFEPYTGKDKSINQIRNLTATKTFHAIAVESQLIAKESNRETILYSTDSIIHKIEDNSFKGILGVITEDKQGLKALYMGRGSFLCHNEYQLIARDNHSIAAALLIESGYYTYSANEAVIITVPSLQKGYAKIACEHEGKFITVPTTYNAITKTVTATLKEGYGIKFKLIK